MKTKYTKKINGIVETFTFQRTRKDRNCHICKTIINKGDQYAAGMKFWVKDCTQSMPVCTTCANREGEYRIHGNTVRCIAVLWTRDPQ